MRKQVVISKHFYLSILHVNDNDLKKRRSLLLNTVYYVFTIHFQLSILFNKMGTMEHIKANIIEFVLTVTRKYYRKS